MKEQLKRYILFWVQQVFEIAVPLLLLNSKYPFIRGIAQEKPLISFSLIFAMTFLLGKIRTLTKKWFDDMKEGVVKACLKSIKSPASWILAYIIVFWCGNQFDNMIWIVKWSMVSSIVGSVFGIWHTSILYDIHAEERKEGRRS